MHQKLYEAAKIKAAQDAEDAIQARKVKPGVTGMNRESIHFLIQERLMRRAQEEGERLAQEEWRQNQAGPDSSPVAAQGMGQPLAPMGAAPSAAHAPDPQTAPAQPAIMSQQEAPAAGASIPGKGMAFKRPFSLFGDDENAIENAAREDAWRIVQAEREAEAADDTPPGYNKILWKASKEAAEKKRKEKRAATDEWLKTYFEQRQAEETKMKPAAEQMTQLFALKNNLQADYPAQRVLVKASAGASDAGGKVSTEMRNTYSHSPQPAQDHIVLDDAQFDEWEEQADAINKALRLEEAYLDGSVELTGVDDITHAFEVTGLRDSNEPINRDDFHALRDRLQQIKSLTDEVWIKKTVESISDAVKTPMAVNGALPLEERHAAARAKLDAVCEWYDKRYSGYAGGRAVLNILTFWKHVPEDIAKKFESLYMEDKMALASLPKLQVYSIRNALDVVNKYTNELFPEYVDDRGTKATNFDGTPANAFKHAFWSAYMAVRIGPKAAQEITDAHEVHIRHSSDSPYLETTTAIHTAMDLYYNELGRRVAQSNRGKNAASDEELANLVFQVVMADPSHVLIPSAEESIRIRYGK